MSRIRGRHETFVGTSECSIASAIPLDGGGMGGHLGNGC